MSTSQDYLRYILIIILVILLLIYSFYKYNFLYWKRKGVTYLDPIPLFGNTLPVAAKKLGIGEHGALMYKEIKKRNRYFGGYYIFHYPTFIPIDPNLIKTILIKDFKTFHDRGFHCNEKLDPLNNHLITLRGDKWKKARAKVNPTFATGKIKNMFEILVNCINQLDEVLDGPCRTGEVIDINDILARLATDNIANCAFGLSCNSLKDPNTEFRQYGKFAIESTFKNQILFAFSIFFPSILSLLKIPLMDPKITKFFMDLIKQTVKYREENNIFRKDFLDNYIVMKNNKSTSQETGSFSFNELAAMAFVFYVAGFETTETTLTFAMFEISRNEDVQEKIREEISKTLKSEEVTYEEVMEMTYMDQVICEVLRKYPPIPMLNRECRESYKVPGTEVVIDKGVFCWVSILGMHMDPEYYPDPEKFDPERFSEEEKAKRPSFTYLPFGEGPRICIGKRFALLQMKIALIKLLKNYKFSLDSKTILPIGFDTQGIFLAPKNTIWLRCNRIRDISL